MKIKTSFLTAVAAALLLPAAAAPVTLSDFKLTGDLGGEAAAFTLTGTARVDDAKGGALELLSGPVALTSIDPRQKWHWENDHGRFLARFDRSGTFPLEVHFNAAVTRSNDWSAVDFQVARSALQPVVLHGLATNTEFQFTSAARPQRTGNDFLSYLPVDGAVSLAWKQARKESEGKLFYAAEMLAQISVSPDLMRQTALLNGKIMQGELSRLALKLHGAGEVTRVQGDDVLAWNVTPGTNSGEHELIVQFNQPQKDAFAITVHMQTPLGTFPQTA